MEYLKVVKWVWDPLLEGLKGKITIGMDRILKKPLIKEVQKLPITKSGISNDGFSWAHILWFVLSSNDTLIPCRQDRLGFFSISKPPPYPPLRLV
jgi:hypothetical protein